MTTLANASSAWPTITDDDGSGQTGTVIGSTSIGEMEAAINSLVHSSNNATVTPSALIDEVVTARGNKANLNARLAGVIDDDGALVTPATVVSSTQLAAQAGSARNLLNNTTFFLWSGGLTTQPDYWALANGTIAMAGTGQGDTTRYVGKYCAAVTWSSGTATLTQTVLDTTDFANLDHLKVQTKTLGFGAWIKTSIANHARIQIADGNTTTESSYHTGGGGWEWISGTHQMSSASTKIEFILQNAQAGTCYFAGCVLAFSNVAPPLWYPERVVRGSVAIEVPGTLSTGDGKKYITFARPTRIDQVQALVTTDPVGAAITIDLEKFEPTTTWVSILAGGAGALIDDGDGVGQIAATTTAADYDHRCISGWFGASGELSASGQEDKMVRLNIDQVGSGTAGADMFMRIDAVQCMHPFEMELSADFQGI